MKNKTLSAYKKKKIIESFCDELTATQAAHRLNLDRNTINKYFKRIRECIAGYREYQKMRLMVTVISSPDQKVTAVSKQLPASQQGEQGIPIRIMCIDGELVTDIDMPKVVNGSRYLMPISGALASSRALPDKMGNGMDCDDLHRLADDFHTFTANRLKKFFGVRGEYAYLYVKEAEFVYNERDYARREKLLNDLTDQIFL